MGCCASTGTIPSQQHQQSPTSSATTKPHESRTPPPSSIEEKVKEVMLSSYTVSANCQQKQEYTKIGKPAAIVQTKEEQQSPYKINQKGVRNNSKEEVFDALSDTSTTTTVTERKCYYGDSITSRDDNEVRQLVKNSPAKLPARNRSFSGDMGSKRDKVVQNSPSWRFEQSPGRINGVPVKMVQGREPGRVMPGSNIEPGRLDPGERSGRRAMSPGTRLGGMNMGRTPSARRTNMSPGRFNRNPDPKNNNDHRVAGGRGHVVESLENPRVSLECFIFL